MGTSSQSSSSPSLTILSRHQGPVTPTSAPTSARSLTDHIALQLLREEQDAAFRESARRDREKEARRIEEARRTAELEKAAMERQRAADEARARISDARDRWRRECRHRLVPQEEPEPVSEPPCCPCVLEQHPTWNTTLNTAKITLVR